MAWRTLPVGFVVKAELTAAGLAAGWTASTLGMGGEGSASGLSLVGTVSAALK